MRNVSIAFAGEDAGKVSSEASGHAGNWGQPSPAAAGGTDWQAANLVIRSIRHISRRPLIIRQRQPPSRCGEELGCARKLVQGAHHHFAAIFSRMAARRRHQRPTIWGNHADLRNGSGQGSL